jgi:hypothetical protein
MMSLCRNAKRNSGIEFLVGFETEFILLKNTNPIEAINDHGWSIAQAFASGTTGAQVLEEIADALALAGVELQQYHSEAAPGQYEIVTGPLPPLQAADTLIHTRETIYNIASKHGLRATLAPRVFMNSCMSHLFFFQITSQSFLINHFHHFSRRNLGARAYLGSYTRKDTRCFSSPKSEQDRSIFPGRSA